MFFYSLCMFCPPSIFFPSEKMLFCWKKRTFEKKENSSVENVFKLN